MKFLLLLFTLPNEVLEETLRKLNAEIADNNQLLFQGVFVIFALVVFVFTQYIKNDVENITKAQRLVHKRLRALLLALVLSGVWFVARQELLIHSPGTYAQKIEVVLNDIHIEHDPTYELSGWETDRKKQRVRFPLLLLSNILSTSAIAYVAYGLVRKPRERSYLRACVGWVAYMCLLLAGLSAVFIAAIYGGQ